MTVAHLNYSGDVLTMPAWKDADGGTTFCADTEVGSRWGALERENLSDEPVLHPMCQRNPSDLLLCALLMPLETGRGFPEDDELDAEEEEVLALITAACLRRRNNIRSNVSVRFPSDGPAGCGCTHPDLDRGFPSGLQS